jgi:plastocyanin
MLKSLATAAVILGYFVAVPLANAATVAVTINNYTFMPAKITVHPGDTVTWTNQDSIPHTATSLDGKTFDSGAIDPDASWSYTFAKAGTYPYRCSIHPDMQGEVDVK